MRRHDLLIEIDGSLRFGTLVSKTSRAEDNGYTHTRGSTASFIGSTSLQWASSAVPRVAKGKLILEGSATNNVGDTRLNQWLNGTTLGSVIAGADGSTDGRAYRTFANAASPGSFVLAASQAGGALTPSTTVAPVCSFLVKRNSTGATPVVGFSALLLGTVNRGQVSWAWTSTGGIASITASTDATIVGSSVGTAVGGDWNRIQFRGSTILIGSTVSDLQIRASTTVGESCDFANVQVEGTPFATSWIGGTTAAAITRSADTFYVDFEHPPQAMTVYVKFVECGSLSVTNARLFEFGSAAAGDPRFYVSNVGGNYSVSYDAGATVNTATLSAPPSLGDSTEIVATLADTGAVTIAQSINSGTATSASDTSALALPTAWADTRLYVNSAGTVVRGFCEFDKVKVARGVRTMAEMRVL